MPVWSALGINLAIVALFVSLWSNLSVAFANRRRRVRNMAFGAVMGAAAVASMLNAVPFGDGFIIDLRGSVLSVTGLFGGPLSALVTVAIAVTARSLIGGAGAVPGCLSILLSALVGVAVWGLVGRRPRTAHVLVLACASVLAPLVGLFFLPITTDVLLHVTLPASMLTLVATAGLGLALLRAQRRAAERDLLLAALAQAPDFFYIKDTDGRMVAVNRTTATHHGFAHPGEMVGLTDADLTNWERAERLGAEERAIVETGIGLVNSEETISGATGMRVYKTTKVPLRDGDGRVIGLAGVTRDVTERRRLEGELRDSRDLLADVTTQMSDGVALFTREGRLVFCNERYRTLFPLTGHSRQPKAMLSDILREVAATGEQTNLPDNVDGWIAGVLGGLQVGSEEQVQMADGRWLQIRTRPTPNGNAIVVVTDISALKRNEEELASLAKQLRILASTDGLTGLLNRRSFDAALETELARTAEAGMPLSLLIIDVDHFKAFNDRYGHLAGDECLRLVAQCVSHAVRPGDIAARYGGEEFVAILPNADEEQAYAIAEKLRAELAFNAISHDASATGRLTASVGLAWYPGVTRARSAPQLLARADEALYVAKDAGRNRVMGWRPRVVAASVA